MGIRQNRLHGVHLGLVFGETVTHRSGQCIGDTHPSINGRIGHAVEYRERHGAHGVEAGLDALKTGGQRIEADAAHGLIDVVDRLDRFVQIERRLKFAEKT